MRTVDKGGQKCPYLDKALLLSVFLQPGEARAVRAGLQPGQLPAPLRSPEGCVSLVALQHPAEAHKDRRQDYQSLQDDRLSDGGGGCSGKAVPVDAVENSPPGEGLRESARLEPVKDRNGKQGGITCGMTVPGGRENTRPGGKMQGLDALKAAVPGFMRRKGRTGGRISALEAAYEEYRFTRLLLKSKRRGCPLCF